MLVSKYTAWEGKLLSRRANFDKDLEKRNLRVREAKEETDRFWKAHNELEKTYNESKRACSESARRTELLEKGNLAEDEDRKSERNELEELLVHVRACKKEEEERSRKDLILEKRINRTKMRRGESVCSDRNAELSQDVPPSITEMPKHVLPEEGLQLGPFSTPIKAATRVVCVGRHNIPNAIKQNTGCRQMPKETPSSERIVEGNSLTTGNLIAPL